MLIRWMIGLQHRHWNTSFSAFSRSNSEEMKHQEFPVADSAPYGMQGN